MDSKSQQRQFRCELCNMRSPYSEKALKEHTSSAEHRHMRIFLDNGLWPGSQKDCPTRILEPQIFKFAEHGKIECLGCRVDLDNATHLLMHQMGVSHAKNVKRFDPRDKIPVLYYCTACDMCTGTKLATYQIHLASSSHAVLCGNSTEDGFGGAPKQYQLPAKSESKLKPNPVHPAYQQSHVVKNQGNYGSYTDSQISSSTPVDVLSSSGQPGIGNIEKREDNSYDAESISLADPNVMQMVMAKLLITYPWLSEQMVTALIQRQKLRDMMSKGNVQPELVALCRDHYQATTLNIENAMQDAKTAYLQSKGVHYGTSNEYMSAGSSDAVEAAMLVVLNSTKSSLKQAPTDMELASDHDEDEEIVLSNTASGMTAPSLDQQSNAPVDNQLLELMRKAAAENRPGSSTLNNLLQNLNSNPFGQAMIKKNEDGLNLKRSHRSRSREGNSGEKVKDRDRSHRDNEDRNRCSPSKKNRLSPSRIKTNTKSKAKKSKGSGKGVIDTPPPYSKQLKGLIAVLSEGGTKISIEHARQFQVVMSICPIEERSKLLDSVLRLGHRKIQRLATDKGSNSILKTFFIYCSEDQKIQITKPLFRSLLRTACDPVGAEIIQQLFSSVGVKNFTNENGISLADALKGKVAQLVYNQVGDFVIKEILNGGTPDQIKALLQDLFDFPPFSKDLPSDSLARARNIRQCINLCTIANKLKLMKGLKEFTEAEISIVIDSLAINEGALMRSLLIDDEACVVVEGVWEAAKRHTSQDLCKRLFGCIPPHKMFQLHKQMFDKPNGKAILYKITSSCMPPPQSVPSQHPYGVPMAVPQVPLPMATEPPPWANYSGVTPKQSLEQTSVPSIGISNLTNQISRSAVPINSLSAMTPVTSTFMANTAIHSTSFPVSVPLQNPAMNQFTGQQNSLIPGYLPGPVTVSACTQSTTMPIVTASFTSPNDGAPFRANSTSYAKLVATNADNKQTYGHSENPTNDLENVGEKLFKMKGRMLSLSTDMDGSHFLCALIPKAPSEAIQMIFDQLCQPAAFMPVVTNKNGIRVMCAIVHNCSFGERTFLIKKLLDMPTDYFFRLVLEGSELVKELIVYEEEEGAVNGAELLFIKLIKIANENQKAVQIIGPLLNSLSSGTLVRLVSGALQGRSIELIVDRNAGTIVLEVFNRASQRQRVEIIDEIRRHLWVLSTNEGRGCPFLKNLLDSCTRDEMVYFIQPLTDNKGALIVKMLAQTNALQVVDRIWAGLVPPMRRRLVDTLDPKLFAVAQELSDVAAMADMNPNSTAAIIFKEMFNRIRGGQGPGQMQGDPRFSNFGDSFGGSERPEYSSGPVLERDRMQGGHFTSAVNVQDPMFGNFDRNTQGPPGPGAGGRVRKKRWDEAS